MTWRIRLDRRRWYILIVASVAYLCSHSYLFGTMATIGFDFLVNLLSVLATVRELPPIEWMVLDIVLRMATIVVGVTINAFAAYVFDLSYLYGDGLQWLFLGVVVLVYIFVRMLDWGGGTWGRTYDKPTWGVDYIFGIVAFCSVLFFMNFVAFGEPYTFMTEMIYIVSVVALVAVSDVKKMHWWAFLLFVFFWAIALVVGLIVNIQLNKDFRFPLSYYFTKTPLIKK